MRKNFGHLAFDGREYTDAPEYPVNRRWAEGYGYHHNASFRTAIMGQASDRHYFDTPAGRPTWKVDDVNIPLMAYGADAPPVAAGGKYDELWKVGGQLLGTVGVAMWQSHASNKQAEMANQAAIEQAKWNAMAASNAPPPASGGGGSTLAIVAVLGMVGLGAAYFLFKDDKNAAEDEE